MKLEELIKSTRSYRRFRQDHRVSREILVELVNLARLSASSANRQPLKFMLFSDESDCSRVFPDTRWAGYLKEWDGPSEGERPSAYIIVLGDTQIASAFGTDTGIAAQSIMLGAVEKDLGGCMIASINREHLRAKLDISSQYEIVLILAIGKPVEEVVIEDIKDNDVKYWRDDKGTHHVPKRPLDELIIN